MTETIDLTPLRPEDATSTLHEYYKWLIEHSSSVKRTQLLKRLVDQTPKTLLMQTSGSTEEGRARWLAARRKGIGGSDASTLFGAPKAHHSRLSLFLEKSRGVELSVDQETVDPGIFFEDGLARWAARDLGAEIVQFPPNTIIWNLEDPRRTASVDRIFLEDAFDSVGEMKVVRGNVAHEWKDGPPLRHAIQAEHYTHLLGLSHWRLCGWIGGYEKVIFTEQRTQEFTDQEKILVDDFWLSVLRNEMPPADEPHHASYQAVRGLFPQATEDVAIQLPSDAAQYQHAYAQAKKEKDDAEARMEGIKAQFAMWLGTTSVGILPDGQKVHFSNRERKNYQKTTIIESITKYRDLRIPEPK